MLATAMAATVSCTTTEQETSVAPTATTTQEPLNVIFMIGDGMGIAQVSSAFYFGEGTPNFKQFNSIGLSRTSAADYLITDSAAGATAFSTGEKTYKRAIGVSKDTVALPTILEQLQTKGYQTGLVSLTSITHATPAAFYAHVEDRDMHEEIATYLSKANVDFFAGGGRKFFHNRTDGVNLYDTLLAKNYHLDTVALQNVVPTKKNAFLLAEEGIPNKTEGRTNFLQEATQQGLNYFEANQKPFFFMIEGSYIDWGGHATNQDLMVQEVLDFDKTIGVVLDFVKTHPNTLLVVTADHETGGASLGKFYDTDANGQQQENPNKVQVNFHDNQHTTELVPVFAMGPGEEVFRGIYENNEIYHKMMKVVKGN